MVIIEAFHVSLHTINVIKLAPRHLATLQVSALCSICPTLARGTSVDRQAKMASMNTVHSPVQTQTELIHMLADTSAYFI